MKMSTNSIIYLNPDYHLKNDIDRVVLYSHSHTASHSASKWISYIHPMQAVILSFFTKNRTLKENIELLSARFNTPFTKIEKLIAPYINNEESFYTEMNGEKIYFPKNVLIENSSLDLNDLSYDFTEADLKCTSLNLSYDRMHKSPQSMTLMLNNRCVTQCKYCYADRKTHYQALTTTEIINIINEAQRLKMSFIDLIGGEIFLTKDWQIILKELVSRNLTPNYLSTKIPFTAEIIQKLCDTGYNGIVQISLDTLDEQTLSKIIIHAPGYLQKLKEGIELLQQTGLNIYIDTILTKHNCDRKSLLSMYEYVKNIKNLKRWEIRVPELSIYTPDSFSEIKGKREELIDACNYVRTEIVPHAEIQILISDKLLHTQFRAGKYTDICFDIHGTCGALQNHCFILPDGKVTLCELLYWHPQFILGNLKEQSIKEIWQSDKAKQLFKMKEDTYRSESTCHTCHAFNDCTERHRKCWVSVIRAYGKQNWDYPDPSCCYAPPILSDMIYD